MKLRLNLIKFALILACGYLGNNPCDSHPTVIHVGASKVLNISFLSLTTISFCLTGLYHALKKFLMAFTCYYLLKHYGTFNSGKCLIFV